jgi:hypothetical protein
MKELRVKRGSKNATPPPILVCEKRTEGGDRLFRVTGGMRRGGTGDCSADGVRAGLFP